MVVYLSPKTYVAGREIVCGSGVTSVLAPIFTESAAKASVRFVMFSATVMEIKTVVAPEKLEIETVSNSTEPFPLAIVNISAS